MTPDRGHLIDGKRVAIIGAGPGGLTLARLLQMRGVEIRVYERDASRAARVQEATLNVNAGEGCSPSREQAYWTPFAEHTAREPTSWRSSVLWGKY